MARKSVKKSPAVTGSASRRSAITDAPHSDQSPDQRVSPYYRKLRKSTLHSTRSPEELEKSSATPDSGCLMDQTSVAGSLKEAFSPKKRPARPSKRIAESKLSSGRNRHVKRILPIAKGDNGKRHRQPVGQQDEEQADSVSSDEERERKKVVPRTDIPSAGKKRRSGMKTSEMGQVAIMPESAKRVKTQPGKGARAKKEFTSNGSSRRVTGNLSSGGPDGSGDDDDYDSTSRSANKKNSSKSPWFSSGGLSDEDLTNDSAIVSPKEMRRSKNDQSFLSGAENSDVSMQSTASSSRFPTRNRKALYQKLSYAEDNEEDNIDDSDVDPHFEAGSGDDDESDAVSEVEEVDEKESDEEPDERVKVNGKSIRLPRWKTDSAKKIRKGKSRKMENNEKIWKSNEERKKQKPEFFSPQDLINKFNVSSDGTLPVFEAPSTSAGDGPSTSAGFGQAQAEPLPKKTKAKPSKRAKKAESEFIADSDSDDGWEEVGEMVSDGEEAVPSAPVAISITMPSGVKKKETDMEKFLMLRLKRREREMRIDAHKTHLLCSLAHGFFLNDVIGRDKELLGLALSLCESSVVDTKNLVRSLDTTKLKKLVADIKKHFPISPDSVEPPPNTVASLTHTLTNKRCPSYVHLTLVILLTLRSLGIEVRLVYSMQPLVINEAKLPKQSGKKETKSSPFFEKIKEEVTGKQAGKGGRKRKPSTDEESEESDYEKKPKKATKRPEKSPGAKPAKKQSSKGESSADKGNSTPVKAEAGTPVKAEPDVPSTEVKSAEKPKTPANTRSVPLRPPGVDYWLDVYCNKEKAYIPVHCITGEVNRFEACEKSASQPVHYVAAFGETNCAKDVTAVFCQNWLTVNRKLVPDMEWWKETMSKYKPKNKKRDEEEDETTKQSLLTRPIPKTVNELKGHPLYIVPRHLLKYEAIYPRNAIPITRIKDDDVYLRDVVHLLHTRQNWLKEARMIKLGEQPYKEVKKLQRKKRKRRTDNDPNAALLNSIKDKEQPREEMSGLFGYWQTMDYINPVAKDGKVPKNEYGNVEMFQPSMLPIGCVHIPIKGINKVARKLGIDCAAAMTGWEFGGGGCHPVMDGWVVCKEFEDALMDAWNNEQERVEAEDKQKRSLRAVDNWRRLMRGLQWKKKLQYKYGVDASGVETDVVKKLRAMKGDDSDSD